MKWLPINHFPYNSPPRELHQCGICLKDSKVSNVLQSFVWIDWVLQCWYGTYACPECLSRSEDEVKAMIKEKVIK